MCDNDKLNMIINESIMKSKSVIAIISIDDVHKQKAFNQLQRLLNCNKTCLNETMAIDSNNFRIEFKNGSTIECLVSQKDYEKNVVRGKRVAMLPYYDWYEYCNEEELKDVLKPFMKGE